MTAQVDGKPILVGKESVLENILKVVDRVEGVKLIDYLTKTEDKQDILRHCYFCLDVYDGAVPIFKLREEYRDGFLPSELKDLFISSGMCYGCNDGRMNEIWQRRLEQGKYTTQLVP